MDRLAIWLTPAEPAASAIRADIATLAVRLGRVPFEPHITLAAGMPRDETERLLAEIAARHSPYALAPAGVESKPDFQRAATVDFTLSPAHAALRGDLLTAMGWDEPPRAPHMSLTYGEATGSSLIAPRAARLTALIVFDAIRPVRYNSPVDSQEKVAAWKLGASIPLRA